MTRIPKAINPTHQSKKYVAKEIKVPMTIARSHAIALFFLNALKFKTEDVVNIRNLQEAAQDFSHAITEFASLADFADRDKREGDLKKRLTHLEKELHEQRHQIKKVLENAISSIKE